MGLHIFQKQIYFQKKIQNFTHYFYLSSYYEIYRNLTILHIVHFRASLGVIYNASKIFKTAALPSLNRQADMFSPGRIRIHFHRVSSAARSNIY